MGPICPGRSHVPRALGSHGDSRMPEKDIQFWPRNGPLSHEIKIRDRPYTQNFAVDPAVIVVWPGVDFFFDHFFPGSDSKSGFVPKTAQRRPGWRRYRTRVRPGPGPPKKSCHVRLRAPRSKNPDGRIFGRPAQKSFRQDFWADRPPENPSVRIIGARGPEADVA